MRPRLTPGWDLAIKLVIVALVVCVFVAIATACRPDAPNPPQERRDTGAYYASCDDAPGPLKRGDRGYRPALDADGDGVACDG